MNHPGHPDGENCNWNGVGQLVNRQNLDNGIIQTQHLADGVYYGRVVCRDKEYRFIRQK